MSDQVLTAQKRLILVAFFFISSFYTITVSAQTAGDYRSNVPALTYDAEWSDRTNWQVYRSGSWQTPNASEGYPGQFRVPNIVTIREHLTLFVYRAMHLDVSPAFSINNMVINDGGILNTVGNPNIAISQTMTVSNGGQFNYGGSGNLTVTGQANIAGTFTDSNGGGSTVFNNSVTVTGTFTATSVTNSSRMVFRQGIVQNGTFNAGAATFNTNNQNITGNNAISFSGDVDVTGVTLTMSNGNSLFIGGTTTLRTSGGFTRSNGNSATTFVGNVDVGPGTTFNTTSVFNNADRLFFRGGITNNGTFNAGAATFSTNSQSLTGSNAINFSSSVVVTGGSVTVTNSNAAAVNLTGVNPPVLSGNGRWTQDVNSTLNFNGGSITLNFMNASAVGNTVNYNRSDAQTIYNPTSSYYHLILSGGGTKSSSNHLDIDGDLTITGSAQLNVDSGNDNINLAGNWIVTSSNVDPFVEGTEMVTFDGTQPQTLSTVLNAGETFHRFNASNSSASIPQISFLRTVTVIDRLDLDAIIDLNDLTFTLGTPGGTSTLKHISGYVYNGGFRRFWPDNNAIRTSGTSVFYGLFPVGHSTPGSFRPVRIQSTANVRTTNAAVTVRHVHVDWVTDLSPAYDETASISITRKHNAQYLVSSSGSISSTGTFDIRVVMTDLEDGNPINIRLAYNTGATTVSHVGTHLATTSATSPNVGRGGLSASDLFRDWRITTANIPATPLPIQLASIDASVINDAVNVNWRTVSELNNDYFTLERASDLERFMPVARIAGNGTTHTVHDYSYMDEAPLYGRSYYRLKQTDFDGTYSYSKVVTIDYNGPRVPSLKVYANPSDGRSVNLIVNGLTNAGSIPVQVVSANGVVVYQNSFEISSPGVFQRQIQFTVPLKKGIYFVRAGQTFSLVEKLIVN